LDSLADRRGKAAGFLDIDRQLQKKKRDFYLPFPSSVIYTPAYEKERNGRRQLSFHDPQP
jgi:hypothetical protein